MANRVQQIQEHSSPDQWRYVDIKSNPADHASRGLTPQGLSTSNWITGLAFLWKDEVHWSATVSDESSKLSEDDPEVKTSASLVTATDKQFPSLANRLEYFSGFHRAKKAVVLCLLYIRKLRARVECRTRGEDQKFPERIPQSASSSQPTPSRHITVELMQQAEMIMVKSVQEVHYEEKIKALKSTPQGSSSSKGNTVKMSSPLLKLDPFLKRQRHLKGWWTLKAC